ncbi:hypothetical protein VTN00DRAFT_6481 [Thermoascus crustaceus]|uniref:uncharacterized protein n=1 Tax=Thermoascus crustaceus TaxID=5088 RepID=UPI003742523D
MRLVFSLVPSWRCGVHRRKQTVRRQGDPKSSKERYGYVCKSKSFYANTVPRFHIPPIVFSKVVKKRV